MKHNVFFVLLLFTAQVHTACNNALDFTAQKLRSSEQLNFCAAFSGKVLLVVNTASQCGFTPQFKGLQTLYEKYREQGLEIVGFPSPDFNQEYDDEHKVADICYINYGVGFPMLAMSSVTGPAANDFFIWLAQAAGQAPKWNFNKYLIGHDAVLIAAYPSHVAPLNSELEQAIRRALADKQAKP